MDDKSLKKIIAKSEYEKGKAFLEGLEEKQSKSLFKPLLVAASVVLLFGVFWIWNTSNKQTPNPQQLYAEHFEAYPNIEAVIVRNENPKTLKARAFYYYETKAYQKALQTFDSLLTETSSDQQKINFYKANILLETDKPATSITIFKSNLEKYKEWQDKNLWYLTLAYLKNNDLENALATLRQLEASASDFKKKQRSKLLSQLE